MYHAYKDVAGFGVFFLEPVLDHVGQRTVSGLVALYYLPGTFVDDYYMVVLVYYFHQIRLRITLFVYLEAVDAVA